ncbi:MAG TPA: kelch repeat-containing protein [Gemmatimonadales bacterium]|nr:kelch repeat-containing protein [Gemmatimonadales bacterium]
MSPYAHPWQRLAACAFPVSLLVALAACGESDALGPRTSATSQPPSGPSLAAAARDVWMTRASMPTARERLAAVVVNGVLYAIGGVNSSPLTTVEAYTLGNNTWTSKAPLPAARFHLNAGVVDGVLYAAGGLDESGEPTTTLYAYNAHTNTWTSKVPMPTAGACGASGVIDGRLYVFTSDCRESRLGADPAFQRYDPTTDRWTALSLPAYGHFLPAAGVIGDKFYLAGGLFETTDPIGNVGQNVEAYDPATDRWTTRAQAPSVRFQTAGAVVNGLLYVVGGGTGTDYVSLVDVYDPKADTWRSLGNMPTARGFLAAAALGGRVYAVGGRDLSGPLGANEAYTPGRRP